MISAWAGSVFAAVLSHGRTVDRAGTQEHGPAFPTFRWLGSYGRFPRGKYSNEASQYVFRCRPEKASLPRAFRASGRHFFGLTRVSFAANFARPSKIPELL